MTILEQFKPEILKRGIEKGKIEGRLEGKLEGKLENSREIALKMLKRGLTLEEVAEDTGLPLSELKKLKSQIH